MTSPTVFIVGCNWDPCPLNHSIPVRGPTGEISLRFQYQEALFIPSSWNASSYERCILQFYHLFVSALVARKLKIECITEFLLLACYIFTVPYLGPLCYSLHIFWVLLILLSVVTLLEIWGALDYFFLLKKWGKLNFFLLKTHFNLKQMIAVFSVSFRIY